jgi:hypothetical protein
MIVAPLEGEEGTGVDGVRGVHAEGVEAVGVEGDASFVTDYLS